MLEIFELFYEAHPIFQSILTLMTKAFKIFVDHQQFVEHMQIFTEFFKNSIQKLYGMLGGKGISQASEFSDLIKSDKEEGKEK